jgi:hypothetical protein
LGQNELKLAYKHSYLKIFAGVLPPDNHIEERGWEGEREGRERKGKTWEGRLVIKRFLFIYLMRSEHIKTYRQDAK